MTVCVVERIEPRFVSSQGIDPKLTAEENCRYEVEWVTEYACHRDYLESQDCRLTNEQHDISVDLTHLTHSCESSYRTRGLLECV